MDVVVALLRDVREAMVEVGKDGGKAVERGAEEHGLELEFEGAGNIVSVGGILIGGVRY